MRLRLRVFFLDLQANTSQNKHPNILVFCSCRWITLSFAHKSKMLSTAADGKAAFVARAAEPILWKHACLDGDCPLGSLAADSLCAWASNAGVACLIPTRFLGGGVPAGNIAWTDLAEILPPHMITSVTMRASQLKSILAESQSAAWQDCPALSPGWQISGIRLSLSACSSSDADMSVLQANGTFARLAEHAPLRVLTLAPALPLLGDPTSFLAPPQLLSISAQHVVADYMRAKSPFNASAASAPRTRVNTACAATSACAVKVGGARMKAFQLIGLDEYHAARAHASATASIQSGAFGLVLVAAICFIGVVLRRHAIRRFSSGEEAASTAAQPGASHRPGYSDGPISAGFADEISAPSPLTFSTFPESKRDPERQPLRTGSQRVVSTGGLGP